jgi:tetratricopeptide (TPR) repeat protein
MEEARTQNAAGMPTEAVATYEKVLHEYDPEHDDALVELGDLYTDEGRAAEAVPLLERAKALEPEGPLAARSLARALAARGDAGDRNRALELLKASDTAGRWRTRDLRMMATLQAEAGNFAAATQILERALRRRALDVRVQEDIVAVMNAKGDPSAAGMWARRFSHNGLNEFIDLAPGSGKKRNAYAGEFDELDQLIASFGVNDEAELVAVFQGLREPMTPQEMALDWILPRTTDNAALTGALMEVLEAQYTMVRPGILGENFQREVEIMFDFASKASLSVRTITDLNITHDTDAVLLARLARKLGDRKAPYGSCWNTDHYELQMRRLAGKTDGAAAVLSNRACLAGGIDGVYGTWNRKAALPYGLLLLALLYPFVRGWGRLEVAFELPENATAMFAVSLTKRPSKVKDRSSKTRAAATSVFRNQLRRVSRFERRLNGTHMTFRGIPARRNRYYLTIRGPILDLATNSLVGEFLEERVVKIDRGKVTNFKFDLRPREAMVSVEVKRADSSVPRAQVAVRGVPDSTRFCPEGNGTIYLAAGEHVLVVGVEDRVTEQGVQIQGVAPVTVKFDVEYDFVFEGCPKAVRPYLDADYAAAARALSEAGQEGIAEQVKQIQTKLPARSSGEASSDPDTGSSGDPNATSIERSTEDWAKAAKTYEGTHEASRAAEAYREAGDIVNAARCFEEVYDWHNAIECYQDIGDTEKVLTLMERSGELYEAGMLAVEAQQFDRAINIFQQVDSRHPRYSECCRNLAEILSERGEHDLAIEKFDEGLKLSGTAEAPLALLNRYAGLLETAERHEDALGIYEGIRRRDVHFEDVNAHIEALRKLLAQNTTDLISDDAATVVASRKSIPEESRYEIQGELGRGGMGVVYRALDKHLQRVVALKVLPEHLREHETALELFLREARSAAALNHRNIVTVYDAGQEGAMDFISMECLEGSGVDAILKKRGALNAKMVATIALQVASGLDYAQKNKIIHRDIKPSNLFITTDRIVKIMDFGLAKMVEEVRRASTIIGGTPNYMAPEQAIGNPTDHRGDLYALGGTLFHLVTGTVPYEAGDVTYQHAHSPVPDPRERELSVPAPIAELIMKLMAKAPEDRYQSAREVAADLQAFLKSLS